MVMMNLLLLMTMIAAAADDGDDDECIQTTKLDDRASLVAGTRRSVHPHLSL